MIDAGIGHYFSEVLADAKERELRFLNPNKKSHQKYFVDTCEEFLNVISVEEDLALIERGIDKVKIEQIYEDVTCAFQTSRKIVEGYVKGFRTTKETITTIAKTLCWKAVAKLKEGKCAPQSSINKRGKEAGIILAHHTSLEEA